MRNQRVMQNIGKVHSEVSKIIVGQDEIVKKLLIGLIADGHILIEGVLVLQKP